MMTNTIQTQDDAQRTAGAGLAIVRVIVGGMLFSTFFENLGKGAYTPAGYAGVINFYVQHSHSPEAWRHVLAFMASHAAMIAPMQAITEISVGILLILGLFTRPVALVAFLFLATLWVTELELLGSGSYSSRLLHRWASWWDARAAHGALMQSLRGSGLLRFFGE